MADGRGLPLLSGPPPRPDLPRAEIACRKCNKEFNVIFTRAKQCNHCGYSYCSSCTDYQALMPRTGAESGYAVMPVCAYCIEYLTITAGGRNHLKSLPLAKLKKYTDAYNIAVNAAVEKDDVVDGILAVRVNGCLPFANEEYYRKYSVPNRFGNTRPRGLFARSDDAPAPPIPPPRPQRAPAPEFARPDLAPDYEAPPGSPPTRPLQPRPRPPAPQQHTRPQQRSSPHVSSHSIPYSYQPPPQPRTPRPRSQGPYSQGPQSFPSTSPNSGVPRPTNASPRPRATSAEAAPPTLDALLAMPSASIAVLSIGTLKAILFANHVNAGLILEKRELVDRVEILVADEKRERERQRLAEEMEELEARERQRLMMEERESSRREKEDAEAARATAAVEGEPSGGNQNADEQKASEPSSKPPPPLHPKPSGLTATLERTGLCVICQDEEANIAIVDCGHLAMCRGCSDMVMASSRECPLCRTRIVTEARLLRIFKT